MLTYPHIWSHLVTFGSELDNLDNGHFSLGRPWMPASLPMRRNCNSTVLAAVLPFNLKQLQLLSIAAIASEIGISRQFPCSRMTGLMSWKTKLHLAATKSRFDTRHAVAKPGALLLAFRITWKALAAPVSCQYSARLLGNPLVMQT